MTIGNWLKTAKEKLEAAGCPDPAVDARWIAEDILKKTSAQLRFEQAESIPNDVLARLDACLERRLEGEPVQYILKHSVFMGLDFYVDEHVLIPRQDTETLVEAVIVALQGMQAPRVLDLCAGSGAIGLSVKTLVPHADVTLSDISGGAIDVIHKNARLLGTNISVRHGDLYKAINHEKFDLIVSNPPYIPSGEMAELQKEVKFEPALALDGGADGLDFYRRIIADAPKHLNPGGRLYLEVGMDEAQAVLQLAREQMDCADSGVIRDLNGIERIVWVRSR